jgi:tetracenomycin A2 monooxygenase-dioxygenase
VAQALARLQAWFKDPSKKLPPPEPIVDDMRVIFGYRYPVGAFAAEEGPEDLLEDPRAPSGRPGSRAPQVLVEQGGRQVSTIDLFAGTWTLAVGPSGERWHDALQGSPAAAAIGVTARGISPAGDLRDAGDRWRTLHGVERDGAVLVRPDGFVAWRHADAHGDIEGALDAALARVLRRSGKVEAAAPVRSQAVRR